VRRIAFAVVLGLALLCAGGIGTVAVASPAALLQAQSVTLTLVSRFHSSVCNCNAAKLAGQISSNAAGEEVVILKQLCGRSFGTADAVATTREGGSFEAEVRFLPHPDYPYSLIYRARWKGQLSVPLTIRGRLSVTRKQLSGRRAQVVVFTGTNPVNLKGRTVALQRQTGDGWTRVASARLAPHPVKYYTFVATFTVPRRGWTLRALVPAKSAAPCFTASASEKWTS
jgi:hypothetical protein